MTNKEIFDIAYKLGLVTDDDVFFGEDIIDIINFVDSLLLENDTATIKQFLIAVIMKNNEKENKNNR